MRKLILWALTAIVKGRHARMHAHVIKQIKAAEPITATQRRDAALSWDHAPDFIIGTREDPYLYRWFITPKGGVWWFPFNIYFHKFIRSDEDTLHDHPWDNMSMLLDGAYIEHHFSPQRRVVDTALPPTVAKLRKQGGIYFRKAETAHRVELLSCNPYDQQSCTSKGESPVWSLFITGRKRREWGFWCPKRWVGWQQFVASVKDYANGGSARGKGCED